MKFKTRTVVRFYVLSVIVWVMGLCAPAALAAIQFKDVTHTAGVAKTTISYGSSWADFDGDGRPDLWVSNHWSGASLYRNRGDGTFADVTPPILSKSVDRHGAAWADFDNDGDQDLLVLTGGKLGTVQIPNQFFINDKGTLKESATRLGLDYPGRGRMALWFDWNGDGDLDVLLVNQRRPDRKFPTALFTQDAGQFVSEKIAKLFPINNAYLEFAQLSLSNACTPGVPVVVIQRRNNYPARIYGFDEDGFQNSKNDFGFPKVKGHVTDAALADFDGDLITDFFIARRKDNLCKLFVQTPNGVKDATADADLNQPLRLVQSVVAADFDNDMDVVLYLVRFKPRSNRLFENLGDGTFRAVPEAGGAQGGAFGRGHDVTTADFDMDGFMDLFVTNGNGTNQGPNLLFRNQGNANHWLEVDLEGTVSNRDGIGAELIATVGGVDQLREQNGGVHAHAQNHSRIHFGCWNHTRVDFPVPESASADLGI